MADLRREDGVLIRALPDVFDGHEDRAHELAGVVAVVRWVHTPGGFRGDWTASPYSVHNIGTRAELAALAKAFPVEPDRG